MFSSWKWTLQSIDNYQYRNVIGISQNNDHKTRGTYPTSVHKITWIVVNISFLRGVPEQPTVFLRGS
jgi:hypothetical protein